MDLSRLISEKNDIKLKVDKLEQIKDDIRESVYTKIKADYSKRIEEIDAQIKESSEGVKQQISDIEQEIIAIRGTADKLDEQIEEMKVRSALGDISEDELASGLEPLTAEMNEKTAKIESLETELTQLRELAGEPVTEEADAEKNIEREMPVEETAEAIDELIAEQPAEPMEAAESEMPAEPIPAFENVFKEEDLKETIEEVIPAAESDDSGIDSDIKQDLNMIMQIAESDTGIAEELESISMNSNPEQFNDSSLEETQGENETPLNNILQPDIIPEDVFTMDQTVREDDKLVNENPLDRGDNAGEDESELQDIERIFERDMPNPDEMQEEHIDGLKCPKCGHMNKPDLFNCEKCGSELL